MNFTKPYAAYKHFYQEVIFYVGIVIPYLAVAIDALNNEVRYGSADHSSLFPLLVKLSAALTTVYTAAKGAQTYAIANNATPNVAGTVAPDGSIVQQ